MIDITQLKWLIQDVLTELRINSSKNVDSDSAVNLLLGTAAVESDLGTYIKQINGPALGIFQMEPETHDDIWDNYILYRYHFKSILDRHCPSEMIYNMEYSIMMARLYYYRVPDHLPAAANVHGLALYWKKHYNTSLGAGTVEGFKNAYRKYVLKT